MRTPDLYSRLLLTLIAGSLLYIAGTLRTLVQQADAYAAQPARPAAVPVSWHPAPSPPAEPTRVYIAGFSRYNGGWQDQAFDYHQGKMVMPVVVKK
ncbi:hypothetical protein EJV47_19005 [Hymenobacter gummosus]|uniref:Uncharacterized protein n=1 Tax=Hymenobacter gummosus TaxID=1776032 RepID=A0A3S0H4F6_9BACT|nr:hypothetical protein [Hymenobacter gummosus]RTQ47510.1 hypothetical protein EJV47_19005 [Hymenobacter gummosus]